MHVTQMLYATAKAQMEAIQQRRSILLSDVPPIRDEVDIDRYTEAENEIETALGYWSARETLINAEAAMVEWARGVMQSDAKVRARYAEVAPVFDKGLRFLSIRARLIDLCFRLNDGATR